MVLVIGGLSVVLQLILSIITDKLLSVTSIAQLRDSEKAAAAFGVLKRCTSLRRDITVHVVGSQGLPYGVKL